MGLQINPETYVQRWSFFVLYFVLERSKSLETINTRKKADLSLSCVKKSRKIIMLKRGFEWF